ncbi:MAG: ABC transporter permease, partial [Planifilum fimeticola]
MKAYLQLTKAQLLLFARNRNIVIWTLFFPIFMMLALGNLVGDGMRFQVKVAVADEDGSAASRQFVGELEKTEGIDLVPSSEGGGEMIRSGEADLVIVVKKGFGRRVASPEEGETARLIALYYDKGNPAVAEIGTALIRQTVDRLNKRLVRFQPVIGVEEINVQSRPMSYIDFLVPGILSLMIMSNNLNGVAGTIASWRERGILRRMQGTPLSSATFIAGQITARILLNAVQAIAVLLVAYFVFDVHVYGSWAALIFFILLGTLTFLSIGFIIASLARSPE